MRPALKPGLLPVWRNRDTVQIGIDCRRAIALTGMRGAGGLLRLLDGSRDRAQVINEARELGMDPDAADKVITLLAAGGALDDFPVSTYRAIPPGLRARLAPELATASLAHGDGDGGARTLARRQAACVRVHGVSRAALWIAGLLTTAGIGLVISTGVTARPPGQPGPEALIPPGPDMPIPSGPPEPQAQRISPAARRGRGDQTRGNHTASARTRSARTRGRRRPDLVVLADWHRRELPTALLRAQVPHLTASASEAIGVVGPLVLPGRSACLRCLDLARAARDPAWPLILAQLTSHAAADPAACDGVLAAMVAAQTAAQVLAFIDRGPAAAAVISGTLELVLPGWQWRRRTWQPHHLCGCGTRTAP